MGRFERFLSIWVAAAIAAGIGLGLAAPGVFETVADLEVASVNLVVAVLIWLMIYPMMLKVEPGCLADVGRKPKGLALTLDRQLADQAVHHGGARRALLPVHLRRPGPRSRSR